MEINSNKKDLNSWFWQLQKAAAGSQHTFMWAGGWRSWWVGVGRREMITTCLGRCWAHCGSLSSGSRRKWCSAVAGDGNAYQHSVLYWLLRDQLLDIVKSSDRSIDLYFIHLRGNSGNYSMWRDRYPPLELTKEDAKRSWVCVTKWTKMLECIDITCCWNITALITYCYWCFA